MAFKEIDFLTPLREFLVEYPALKPGESLSIDYLTIDPRNQNKPQGEALAFVGSSVVRENKDVTNSSVLDEQANLILILRRYTSHNDFRRDIGDFIFNFNRWINYENAMRGTSEEHKKLPHFSMTKKETIRADGGMQTAVDVGKGIDEFQLQVHLSYQTTYSKPTELW